MTLTGLYPVVKTMHIGLVLASGGLFVFRGLGVIFKRDEAMRAPVRYLSYGIDTALLAAALLLLAILQLNPLTTSWLMAKLALLLAYIVLGSLALKRAHTRSRRVMAFVAALLCFGAMYSIARRHNPLGFMDWFLQ